MKNKVLILGAFVFLTTLSISCNKKAEETTAAPVVDKEQIKMEIQAIENTFAAHYNAKNTDSITYYADDAKSFFIGREPITGKDSIIEYLKKDMESLKKGVKISFTTTEVHVSNDGINVTEIGQFKLVDSTNTTTGSGNYFSLFEKRNGKFVCIRDMAASDSKN
ncbi:YybH family protein [Flavobacterium nackdongense]|uniref:Nuclear transport factor 2 family protein n=1 Tax=Flavobacterium nackdongense TaxID=2547394 RepID=A0A4P6YDS7_9FLAO|nr:nuclear transport factor 2 family protein [Flavobacterium nackdongense]QBN18543.1 nuclear transport factor 2 family protein [Flavobacterium nackdongense]